MPNRLVLLSPDAILENLRVRLALLQADAQREAANPKGSGIIWLRGQIDELHRTIEMVEHMALVGEIQGTPMKVRKDDG